MKRKSQTPKQRGGSWAVRQAEGFRNSSFHGAAGQRPLDLEPDEVIGDINNLAAGGYTSPKAHGSQRKIGLLFSLLPIAMFALLGVLAYGLLQIVETDRDGPDSIKPTSGGDCVAGSYDASFGRDAFEETSESFRVLVRVRDDDFVSENASAQFPIPEPGELTIVQLSASDVSFPSCESIVTESRLPPAR